MCFWLNYCDGNHHIKRIPIAVKNMDHLFCMATEIIEFDVFNLFLLSDGTRIDDNKYLDSLENGTELISVRRNKSRNCQSVLNWKDIYALKTSHIRYTSIIFYDTQK